MEVDWKKFYMSRKLTSITSVVVTALVLWGAVWYYQGIQGTYIGDGSGHYFKSNNYFAFPFSMIFLAGICVTSSFMSAVKLEITVKIPSIIFYGSICLSIMTLFLTPLIFDYKWHLRILPYVVFTATLSMVSTSVGLKIWPFSREGGQRNITMDEYLRN